MTLLLYIILLSILTKMFKILINASSIFNSIIFLILLFLFQRILFIQQKNIKYKTEQFNNQTKYCKEK